MSGHVGTLGMLLKSNIGVGPSGGDCLRGPCASEWALVQQRPFAYLVAESGGFGPPREVINFPTCVSDTPLRPLGQLSFWYVPSKLTETILPTVCDINADHLKGQVEDFPVENLGVGAEGC
jgi:hypothetical protein